MPATYSLSDLTDAADVTPRTIRYYIAQGLIPGSSGVGPGARYTEGHLLRLRLIKQLQREHLPLAEIRQRLAMLDDIQIETLLAQQRSRPARESAVDYIRGVLSGPQRPQYVTMARRSELPDAAEPPPPPPVAAQMAGATLEPSSRPPDRSQWDRIALAPDVELHVRRPLSRIQNKRVERLIAIAHELLEEDQR